MNNYKNNFLNLSNCIKDHHKRLILFYSLKRNELFNQLNNKDYIIDCLLDCVDFFIFFNVNANIELNEAEIILQKIIYNFAEQWKEEIIQNYVNIVYYKDMQDDDWMLRNVIELFYNDEVLPGNDEMIEEYYDFADKYKDNLTYKKEKVFVNCYKLIVQFKNINFDN